MVFAVKNKKWFGYALYLVLVTLVLLYYLFPARAVEEFIDNSVSQISPAYGFEAEKIRPWLPVSMRINTGRVYLRDAAVPAVFETDRLDVRPRILKLIRGTYSIDISGAAYNGDIKGSFFSKDKEGKALESELYFSKLDLSEYPLLAEKFKHKVTGWINGEIFYSKDPAGAANGDGKADLRLTDGQLQFEAPIFGISSVDLKNIDLELELRNRAVTVVRAELNGSEVKASMTGSIQLQSDIKLSQLNLKGTLEPLAEFYKSYPEIRELLKSMKKRVKRGQYFFAITGTLGDPRFRLL